MGRDPVHQVRRVVGRGLRETSRVSAALAARVAPWAVAPAGAAVPAAPAPVASPRRAPVPAGRSGGHDYGALWSPGDEDDARGLILNEQDDVVFERTGRADAEHLAAYVAPGATALDYGCGIGRVARYMAPHCGLLWAVDASPAMLRMARQRLAAQGSVRLSRSTGTAIPEVPDGSVDFVYSLLVLQHVEREDAFAIMREFHRVLRPGGRAWLTFPNLLSDAYLGGFLEYVATGQSSNAARARMYTPQEVERLLPAAGFTVDALDPAENIGVLVTRTG